MRMYSQSTDTIEEINNMQPALETRYTALLDTEKYDIACKVLYNIDNNTDAGKLIFDIDEIGQVSLNSKDHIQDLKNRYAALTPDDKKTILNYSKLVDAENTYNTLKKEEDERIAAEKKAEEERLAAEKEAEEKAKEEAAAAEAKRKEDESKENMTVYFTKSWGKYHTSDCWHLRSIGGSMTQGEALRRGYKPCEDCINKAYDLPSWYSGN